MSHMTPAEYLEETKRTLYKGEVKEFSCEDMDLLHAVVGMSGETGELSDQIKKHFICGEKLDVTNLLEECGDILFYMSIILRNYDSSFEKVMEANIEKLKIRYKDGFSRAESQERNLDEEGKKMKDVLGN